MVAPPALVVVEEPESQIRHSDVARRTALRQGVVSPSHGMLRRVVAVASSVPQLKIVELGGFVRGRAEGNQPQGIGGDE